MRWPMTAICFHLPFEPCHKDALLNFWASVSQLPAFRRMRLLPLWRRIARFEVGELALSDQSPLRRRAREAKPCKCAQRLTE